MTASKKQIILQDLLNREPIFHHPEFGTTREDFENMIAPDFWEVGASGKCYHREQVLTILEERYKNGVYEDEWEIKDVECQEIAPNNYLLTYTLLQEKGQRVSRCSTIWRRVNNDWKIVYH